MTYDPYEVIARESAELLLAARGNLHRQVPSCPEWTMDDLVWHLTGVQRFHTMQVQRGIAAEPTDRPQDPTGDLLEELEAATKALIGTLKEQPQDGPAWNWAPHTPQVVAFWPRRMALEAAIHRWDAQSALSDASGFDLAVAVDGIDEVLTVCKPAAGPSGRTGVVQVRLTDSDRTWTLDLADWSATEKTPDAVLEGTASGVFLALWGRLPLSSFVHQGDELQVAALRTG